MVNEERVEKTGAKILNEFFLMLDANRTLIDESTELDELHMSQLHFVGVDLAYLFQQIEPGQVFGVFIVGVLLAHLVVRDEV